MSQAQAPLWIAHADVPRPLPDVGPLAMTPLPDEDWSAMLGLISAGKVQGYAVQRLSDLGLMLPDLRDFIGMLQANQTHFLALQDGLDTRRQGFTPLLACVNALSDMTRTLRGDRTRAGQARAIARGGRPPGRAPYLDPDVAARATQMLRAGRSPTYVRRKMGLSYEAVKRLKQRLLAKEPSP